MSAEEVEDDAPGDVLEEAGALEADVGARFDQQLGNIDPRLKIDMDPLAHRDLRPEMMFIRDELRQAKFQALAETASFDSPAYIFDSTPLLDFITVYLPHAIGSATLDVTAFKNMAASMMEILKQIQHDLADQKEYMRNLHVINRNINEKYNLMAGKIDQQQFTIERLEQQVRKNNTLLFGYEEKEVNIEDKTPANVPGVDNEKPGHLEQSETNTEENQFNSLSTVAVVDDTGSHCEDDNSNNDGKKASGEVQVEEVVTNKFNEDKELTSTYVRAEQIKQLIDDLKQNAFMYQSEIIEIKGLMKNFAATTETAVGDGTNLASNLEFASTINLMTDQINKLNDEFKNIMEVCQSDMKEIKEFIKGFETTTTMSTEDNAIVDRKQETVQISLDYLSSDQITKLNADLEEITDKYQSKNIFPIIEVLPGPVLNHHAVIRQLTRGVKFCSFNTTPRETYIRIKLGMKGFERSKVQDLLIEYPNFVLYDVVREGLRSTNDWSNVCDTYDWTDGRSYFS